MNFERFLSKEFWDLKLTKEEKKAAAEFDENIANGHKEIMKIKVEMFQMEIFKRRVYNRDRNLSKTVKELNEKLKERSTIVMNLGKVVNLSSEKTNALKDKLAVIQTKAVRRKMEMEQKKQHIECIMEYFVRFHKSISDLLAEIEQLEKENTAKKEEQNLDKVEEKIHEAEMEIIKVNEENASNEERLKQLESELAETKADLENLVMEDNELNTNIEMTQSAITIIREEIDSYDTDEAVEINCVEIENIFDENEDDLKQLTKKRETILDDLDLEFKNIRKRNEDLIEALVELDTDLTLEELDVEDSVYDYLDIMRSGDPKRALELELEGKRCELNQAEEQLMHLMSEMKETNDVLSVATLDHESVQAKTLQVMQRLRTSTPNVVTEDIFDTSFLSIPSNTITSQSSIASRKRCRSSPRNEAKRSTPDAVSSSTKY